MFIQEIEELEELASKVDALVSVTVSSCEKEDLTTQQIVLEEVQKYTSELSERLTELSFATS